MSLSPRKRLTKRRQGNRRSQKHGKTTAKQSARCSNCSSPVKPHSVCHVCGFYKGRKVLAKLAA